MGAMSFRRSLLTAGAGLAMLLPLVLPSLAAERVTLKNGFDLICDHRQEADGRVRLYTGPGSANFLEVDQAEIASVEVLPDTPVTAVSLPKDRSGAIQPAVLTKADLGELIAKAGAGHNIDVDLLASVVKAESDGNTRAVSRAGAQGLMQLMQKTAVELGITDSFRPEQNIDGGTAYLDALLIKYHDKLALALAAYNAGPTAVDKYHGVPPYRETRIYVARVIREFNRRKQAEIGARAALAHNAAAE